MLQSISMKQLIAKKYRRFILYIEIFIVIMLLPVFYNLASVKNGNTTFYIYSSGIDNVVSTLEKNGYTVTFIDRLMLQIIRTPDEGWYSVDPDEYGRLFFYEYLHRKKSETMDIVIFAGETRDELIERLSKDMKLDQNKLTKAYKTLSRFKEADILAKKYTVARKADEDSIMEYLFYISKVEFKKLEQKNSKRQKLKTLLTIASIIQKESNKKKEMSIISSVIYNRLDKNMRLQMDGTLNYGKHSHTIVTPERIKNDKSRYNTYKHKGLPPTPLATVSLDSLNAAIAPRDSDYLYFMLNKDGNHSFSVTYDEHLKKIKVFRAYQKEKADKKRRKLKKESRKKAKAEAIKKKKMAKEVRRKKLAEKKRKEMLNTHSEEAKEIKGNKTTTEDMNLSLKDTNSSSKKNNLSK